MAEHFHSHSLLKKHKKKLQYKKNRFHERLFHLMRLRRAEALRVKEMDALLNKKQGDQKTGKEWLAGVSKVRNRLTGKKRESKERWNRFAGTGESGGRGL